MHPEIQQSAPGMCPECGMNLVPAKNHKHHGTGEGDKFLGDTRDGHAGHSTELFLRKFWVSALLTIPVVLYSDILQAVFGWIPPEFPGSRLLPFLFGSVVFFYGGWIFIAGAWREICGRLPGMMTLIALAITAAYGYSVFAVLSGSGHTLFWELTTLITIMLLGHWIEMRAVSGAQSALKELSKLLPDTAEVIRDGKYEVIPLGEIREGDVVFVRPGGRIPADGTILEGRSDVNESMITGESQPVKKVAESDVIAGTINGEGSLKIRVTKIGERTFLAGVMRLVREAQASKSRLQILSDRAAFYLTAIAIGIGGLTFVLWMLAGAGFSFALERLVAVLVIACPHALGLAVPLVASISTTLAARHGFLVRQRLALEMARKVNVVLFDKTGTLTRGAYGITRVWNIGARDEKELLQLAASVDFHSEHFISRAIVEKAKEYIAAGDIFQVVLSHRFERETNADAFSIYRALRRLNPSPYMFFLDFGDTQFIGRATFNSDTGGFATVKSGDREVSVTLQKPYAQNPVVTASLVSTGEGDIPIYFVSEITTSGFKIKLVNPISNDIQFSWIAIETSGTPAPAVSGSTGGESAVPVATPSPVELPTATPASTPLTASPTAQPTDTPTPVATATP